MTNRPVSIVQFTDTHFFGTAGSRLVGIDTTESFLEVSKVARRTSGTPDLYLLTGDLSQDETEQSYARLAACLKDFQAPAYYLPGNHDVRNGMHKVFAESGAPLRSDRQIIVSNWQIILLDTLVEGQVPGRLSPEELGRLDAQLAKHPHAYGLIAMHHPPLPIGCRWMDAIGLENGSDFFTIIDKYPRVKVVVCGHIHQEYDSRRNGVRLLGTPSTGVQFKPRAKEFGVDAVPAGYREVTLNPDGSVATQVVRADRLPEGLNLGSPGY